MDFGTLLHVAKKNNESSKCAERKYYSTKFSAPKKESKEKTLSENIKKFLAKKEQEERERVRIEKEKRDELLAMRDEKSKNKIKKMLKVIKSANKSVLEDAVDTENTAITLQGPDQPDEDDYGYVSNEAAAFYKKYMDKVKSLPEENKFAPSRPLSKTDISGTKDRVRAAIQKEQEERSSSSRSKSSKQSQSSTATSSTTTSTAVTSATLSSTSHRKKDLYDPTAEREIEDKKRKEEEQKKAKVKKPAPPILDFKELLKLAEKKQHEPVEIVVETKKEPERLLTKKEKKELEERQRYLEEKERRRKEGHQNPNKSQINGKIPKNDLKESSTSLSKKISSDKNVSTLSSTQKMPSSGSSITSSKQGYKKPSTVEQVPSQKLSNTSKSKVVSADQKNNNLPINDSKLKSHDVKSNGVFAKPAPVSGAIKSTKPTTSKANIMKPTSVVKPTGALSSSKISNGGTTRQFPPKDAQATRKPSLSDKEIRPKQFPPPDLQRTRQFPPSDVRSNKLPKKPQKRRILDDDEDEYDSELDDFIDDGPEEDQSYSNYIKEIFGYDKSRYRDVEDDDTAMESTFAQQMKEEYLSKKFGLMEDLEDMRLEAEEKKRKSLMKKKKLK